MMNKTKAGLDIIDNWLLFVHIWIFGTYNSNKNQCKKRRRKRYSSIIYA